MLAYARNTNGDYTQGIDLYVADASGKRVADLRSQLDRNVNGAAWDGRGDALWVATPDKARSALWYWPLHGHITRIDLGSAAAGRARQQSKSGVFVFTASSATHPPEIYYAASPTSKPVALTDDNGFVAKTGVAR